MVHLYGLVIGIAVVVGWSLAEKLEPRIMKVAPWVLGMGLVGARVWHVVDMWEYYSQNLTQIPMVWRGGLAIWGALIAGSIVLCLYFKGRALQVMGKLVVALPVSQAIGRVGNGLNGEFVNQVWILPWWGMEAVLDLLLFGLLWGLHQRSYSALVKVGVYWIGYGLIRLVLQPYRM